MLKFWLVKQLLREMVCLIVFVLQHLKVLNIFLRIFEISLALLKINNIHLKYIAYFFFGSYTLGGSTGGRKNTRFGIKPLLKYDLYYL